MSLESFIGQLPKVELHVHLEGSIPPETLLLLAERNGQHLPVTNREELAAWYRFKDFAHFIEIYQTISRCIRTAEDIELIARGFLQGQAEQNILHSEVTYTPYTHFLNHKLRFKDQLAAINRARVWAEAELGVTMSLTIDYPRELEPEGCLTTAQWAISGMGDGVSAFGLGGPEAGNPPEKFKTAFDLAHSAGLPCVPHAGETAGAESIWGALKSLHAVRIGHGVRCLEDPALVAELRARQVPLEVSLTSNICLGVFDDFSQHALPRLIEEGLYLTVNSDDPPMFNTTLTKEYVLVAHKFNLGAEQIKKLVLNAASASFLPTERKTRLLKQIHNWPNPKSPSQI